MSIIDSKVVEMKFDNREFSQNIGDTLLSLAKLKASLDFKDTVKTSFDNLSQAVKGIDLGGVSSALDVVSRRFSALEIAGITALVRITNKVIDLGKKLVNDLTVAPIMDGFREYELKMGSIQTIVASTGESLKTVNAYLEELNKYSDRTIYSFSDMTQNIGKFTNAGVKLKDAVKAIQGISNEAALSGANANEASRAMYNFAQALSSGAVKLIDWKSIENANMATVEFKQALLDTAVAMGTVVKEGDKYKSVTTDNNGHVSDLFNATQKFNDSLSTQWMTTDVLIQTLSNYSTDIRDMTKAERKAYEEKLKSVGYTDEQIKKIEDLGQKAFDAAQDVKTFTQLMDTLKEAAGSGWAQTFELLFGDLNEAKALWTGVSKAIGGVIDRTSQMRNDLLQSGLRDTFKTLFFKDWTTFQHSGFATEEFKKLLIDTAKESGVAIDSIIESTGSFEKSLREGWLNGELLIKAIDGISDAQLKNKGYSKEEIKNLKELAKAAKDAKTPVGGLIDEIKKTSGRDLLIGSIANLYNSFTKLVGAIKDGFDDIFEPLTGKKLYGMVEAFHKFTESIKPSDELLDKVKRTAKGLFAIFDIGKQVLGALGSAILPIVEKAFSSIGGSVLDTTASLGDYISKLSETLRKNETFVKVTEKIGEVLSTVFSFAVSMLEKVLPLIEPLVEFIGKSVISPSWELFSSILDKIKSGLENLAAATEPIRTKVGGLFSGLAETIKKNKLLDLFGKMWETLKKVGSVIFDLVGKGISFLAEKIKNAKFENVIQLLNAISGLLVGSGIAGIGSFFSSLKKIPKDNPLMALMDVFKAFKENGFKGLGDEIAKGLEGLTNPLQELQNKLKSEVIKTIAMSILILAGAMFVLSMIDADALGRTVLAMSSLFIDLAGTMKVLDTVGGKGKSAIAGLTSLSAAVLILAFAMKVVASINEDALGRSLLAIFELIMMLVAANKAMTIIGNNEGAKGVGGFIAMAIALRILVKAVQKIGDMEPEKLTQAIKGISILIAEMTAAMVAMRYSREFKIGDALSFIAFAAAIGILVKSMKGLADLEPEKFEQALVGISALILEMSIAMRAMSNENHYKLRDSVAFIAFAFAIKILGGVLQDLSTIKWTSLAKAMVAVSLLIGELTGVMLLMGKFPTGSLGNAASFVVIAFALKILAGVVESLAAIEYTSLIKAIIALGALMGGLYLLTTFMKGDLGSAASLILVAVAINMLIPALTAMSKIPFTSLAKSLIGLGIALGLMAGAAILLKGSEGTLLSFAAFLTAAGVSIFLVGAGMVLLATGITMLGQALVSRLGDILQGIRLIIVGFVQMIPEILAALKEVVPELVDFLLTMILTTLKSMAEYIPQIVDAALVLLLGIINAIKDHIPEIIAALVELVGSIFIAIGETLKSYSQEDLENLALGIGAIAGVLTACAGFSLIAAPAMAGIAEVAIAIGEIAAILAAFGALKQIPGLTWLIEQGSDLLNTIGSAIGEFIGSIVGGLAAGATSSLEKVGTNLSDFMIAAAPFFEMVSSMSQVISDNIMSPSDVFTFGDNLQKIVGYLNDFDIGTTNISLDKINTVNTFFESIKNLMQGLKGFDPDSADKLQESLQKLSELSIDEVVQKLQNGKVDIESAANSLLDSLKVSFGTVPDVSTEITTMMQGIVNQVLRHEDIFTVAGKQLASKLSSGIQSGIGAGNEQATDGVNSMMSSSISAVTSQYKSMNDAGKKAVMSLATGIKSESASVIIAFRTPIVTAVGIVRSYNHQFHTAGAYLVKGFANGISSNTYLATARSRAMAEAAKNAAKRALDEHSPSKEMAKIGLNAVLGFVNELAAGEAKAYDTAYSMANGALLGTEKASARINRIIEDGINASPTIRPVIDLSDVQAGANSLNSMFNLDPAVGLSSNLGAIGSYMMLKPSSATNDDVVTAINALRKELGPQGDNIVINGITYDDGSNINDAVKALIRAAKVERRT